MPIGESASPTASFAGRLTAAMTRANSLLCVGLDPDPARFPAQLRDDPRAILQFNAAIIAATADLVCAYKPNLGFYVAAGLPGIEALIETRKLIPAHIPVILDCKVGDVDNTDRAYAKGYFDEWGFDGITANPYLGEGSLEPFFTQKNRGVLLLVKNSNPTSGDFQDVVVRNNGDGDPLYLYVARRAAVWANRYPATIGLVVGATYPAQLQDVRAACPDLPLLLPGVGAQGGDLAASVKAGINAHGGGLIVSASRSVIYAGDGPDFAEHARAAALALRDEINQHRPQ